MTRNDSLINPLAGIVTLAVLVGLHSPASAESGDPSVPGFTVLEYATDLQSPWQMSFDHDSRTLYVGRNGPGVAAFHVYRVADGGSPVSEYGDDPINDPDTVLFDSNGLFGPAGSVLVGGGVTEKTGQLVAILPDEIVEVVTSPTTALENPADMAFDSTGRFILLIDNDSVDSSTVFVSDGGPLVGLISIGERCLNLAIGPDDAIYIATLAGSILKFDSGGVGDASFGISDLGSRPPIFFGEEGPLGANLFTINKNTGELLRLDNAGNATTIGTGFGDDASDMTMDSDGGLYVALETAGRILRVAFCGADLDGSGAVDFADLLAILSSWGNAGVPEDVDGSGTVDFGDLLIVLASWGPCE